MSPERNYWKTAWRRPVSRRTVLRGAAAGTAGLAGLSLLGCGDDSGGNGTGTSASPGAGGGEPRQGGKLAWAWQGSSHLDVHQDSISGAGRIVGTIYNRLFRYADDAQIGGEPDLAAEYEQPDDLTYVFKLQQGVQFHDRPPVNGREMTADDVVYSLERARTDDPHYVHGGDIASVDKIEAVDPYTVRVTTRVPNAILLTTLAGYQFIILAPETVEQFGDIKNGEAAIGTGPFMIERFSPDAGAVMVRNPNYWRQGLPYLDQLEQLDIGDHWSQFRAGTLDEAAMAAENVEGYDSFEEFLEAEGLDAYSFESVSTTSAQAHFMNTKDPLFSDVRIRWALNLLADRRPQLQYGVPIGGYPSIALGDGHKAFHLPQEEYGQMPGFRTDEEQREQDIRDGLALLEQAGYTRENPMVWEIMGWNVPHRTIGIDQLQLAAEMYREVSGGVLQPTVKGIEWGAWKQAEQRYEFQMISSAYSMGVDPHEALQKMYHSEGGRNFAQYADPEFDRMLERELGTFDLDERKQLIHEMLRYLNDESRIANVWIGTGPAMSASHRYIQGRPPLMDYGKVDRLYRV